MHHPSSLLDPHVCVLHRPDDPSSSPRESVHVHPSRDITGRRPFRYFALVRRTTLRGTQTYALYPPAVGSDRGMDDALKSDHARPRHSPDAPQEGVTVVTVDGVPGDGFDFSSGRSGSDRTEDLDVGG